MPLTTPFSPLGNVIPISGVEIDPGLSLLAGQPVALSGVPVGRSNPVLADFAGTAGLANPSLLGDYRTLRGPSRPYDASLVASKMLAPWLTVSFNGRLSWTEDRRKNGLPSARFILPVGHPNSPFGRNVLLVYSDSLRPLVSRNQSEAVNLQLTFNATFGDWRISLSPSHDDRERSYLYDLNGPVVPGGLTIGTATNPFATSVAGLIPVATSHSSSRSRTSELQAEAEGPLLALPTGDLRLRLGAGGT